MFCSTVDEIKFIELKLEEIISSSEQFFLQLGYKLSSCRSRTKTITALSVPGSTHLPVGQLTDLKSDLSSLQAGLTARSQSIEFTLQQTLESVADTMQHGNQVASLLPGLKDLAEIEHLSDSLWAGIEDDAPVDMVRQKETGAIAANLQGLESVQKLLEKNGIQSGLVFERLKSKTEVQHGILNGKSDSLLECLQKHDRQTGVKNEFNQQGRLIYELMDELVPWLQYDDITRQKVGHVNNALADLRCELEQLDQTEGSCDQAVLNCLTAEVCRLQAAHLDFVQDELEQAVTQIAGQFNAIESCCRSIVSVIGDNRRGLASREKSSLGRLDYILEQLHDGLAFNGTAFDVVDDCLETLSQESKKVLETHNLLEREGGSLQKTIALTLSNVEQVTGSAHIESVFVRGFKTKTGRSVEMLNTLGNSFQQIGSDIDLFHNLLSRLKNGAVASVHELRNQTKSLRAKIRMATQDIYEQGESVVSEVEGLRLDLQATDSSLSGLQNTFQMLNDVRSRLTQISETGKAVTVNDLDDHARAILDRLSNRYTMFSERQTHARVTTNCDYSESESHSNDSGSVFGSNIELF